MLRIVKNVTSANTIFKYSKSNIRISNRRFIVQEVADTVPLNAKEPNVLVEKDTNITLIGINRARQRNSINTATAQQLTQALQQFEEDDTSPVAVLYGVGGSFCAGYDLTELAQEVEQGSLNFLLRPEGSVGPTRRCSHLRKPIVCAINGYCVANGLELALLCDLRVMENTAVLGFFNRRFGVPLSDGGSVRLAANVGYSRALELLTTGKRITAVAALEMGLINRLVATGTCLGQAVNLAFSIAKFPIASLQHDRQSLYASRAFKKSSGFSACVENEVMNVSSKVMDEMQKGVQRFKNAETKGAKTENWHVKTKIVADWEMSEITHEEQYQESKTKNKVS